MHLQLRLVIISRMEECLAVGNSSSKFLEEERERMKGDEEGGEGGEDRAHWPGARPVYDSRMTLVEPRTRRSPNAAESEIHDARF